MNFMKFSSVFQNLHISLTFRELKISRNLTVPAGTPGAGAGKGGGGGGSVRESGGALGQYGAAQEEGYFYGKQREQLEKIKKRAKLDKEIAKKNEDED